MYAQMLVGMVALTGQWWLDARKPAKAEVAAHLVNLAWNGLSGLEAKPGLSGTKRPRGRAARVAAQQLDPVAVRVGRYGSGRKPGKLVVPA